MTKHRLLTHASALAATFVFTAAAFAQTPPDTGASPPLDTALGGAVPPSADDQEIVVTGTLIRGTAEDAALPVDVISADELLKQGSPTLVELLKRLPVSNGVLGDTNQFDARAQGSEGVATVNLRGLGPQRTLVLLNSRRFVNAGIGIPAVDINLLPQAAIGRIEILKDGAAATYGSDAIGGVVNFITRTNQEGFLVGGDYRFIDGSKGDYTANASYGHNQEGFRVLFAAGLQHRSELSTTDRDWALLPYAANPEGGWTGGGNPATFLALGPTGAPATGLMADASCAALGGFVTAINRCSTQFTPFDNIVEEEDRYQLYAETGIDLTSGVELVLSALYGRSIVPEWKTSPTYVLTQPPSPAAGITQSGFFVPANNPGLVAYRQQNPTAIPGTAIGVLFPTLLYRPFLAGGNPLFDNEFGGAEGRRESNSMRVTAELRADLTEALDLNLGYTYHKYERLITGFDSFGDRVQLALRGFGGAGCNRAANTPGANGCFFLNPFGNATQSNPTTGQVNPAFNAAIANSAQMAAYFFVPTTTNTDTALTVFDASISGETGFDLAGGPVAFGVGAQYRETTFDVKYGPNNNLAVNPCRDTPINGNMTCTPSNGAIAFLGTNADASASGDVIATFAELQLPFLDTLNLQLAARYEDYGGGVGSTFDPKATVRWQVMPWLALRGSAGTTFRGPPDQQLISRSVTSLQLIGTTFRPVDVFGNASLTPESATSYSAGAIIDSGGLNLSLDYFRYELDDLIVGEPLTGMVNALFGNPANCANPAFAALRGRFTFNDGGGVPGAGTCAITNISRVRTNLINGAGVTTSGLDLIGSYAFDDIFGGRLAVGGTATYVINYKSQDQIVEGIVVQPSFDAVGKLNFQTTAYPLPEWKGQGYVEFQRGIFDTRLTVNYIDSYTDQRTAPFAPRADLPGNPVLLQGKTIDEYVTADINFRLQFENDLTFNFAVTNIFDQDPSFARLELNYDPFTGDPIGRSFKIGVSKRF